MTNKATKPAIPARIEPDAEYVVKLRRAIALGGVAIRPGDHETKLRGRAIAKLPPETLVSFRKV